MPTLEADLPGRLRQERLQKKARQPLARSLFVRVFALVQTYGLGEDFLKKLDEFTQNFSLEKLNTDAVMGKKKLQLPLFALAPPESYRLTMAIIAKIDNPYLYFANSPDEILLCKPLFERSSDIKPQLLAAHHLQTLLSGDSAGEKLRQSKGP